MQRIHASLSDLEEFHTRLRPEDQRLLEKSLKSLSQILDMATDGHDSANDMLLPISQYLHRKLLEAKSTYADKNEINISLRQLRNELTHGRSIRKFDPEEIRKLEPALWRTLEKSSPQWNLSELENFLSYCLDTQGPRVGKSVEPKKLVRLYKAIFNTFDERRRDVVFRELVMRLFSEPRFLMALDETSPK